MSATKVVIRRRRQARIRRKVMGTSERPRLHVFRSGKHIYAQVIDDLAGKTLAAASTLDKSNKGKVGDTLAGAKKIGADIAGKAKTIKIVDVVFDRGGFQYHGRIKALADAAREAGLKF